MKTPKEENKNIFLDVEELNHVAAYSATEKMLGLTYEQSQQLGREFIEITKRHEAENKALIDKANAWIEENRRRWANAQS